MYFTLKTNSPIILNISLSTYLYNKLKSDNNPQWVRYDLMGHALYFIMFLA